MSSTHQSATAKLKRRMKSTAALTASKMKRKPLPASSTSLAAAASSMSVQAAVGSVCEDMTDDAALSAVNQSWATIRPRKFSPAGVASYHHNNANLLHLHNSASVDSNLTSLSSSSSGAVVKARPVLNAFQEEESNSSDLLGQQNRFKVVNEDFPFFSIFDKESQQDFEVHLGPQQCSCMAFDGADLEIKAQTHQTKTHKGGGCVHLQFLMVTKLEGSTASLAEVALVEGLLTADALRQDEVAILKEIFSPARKLGPVHNNGIHQQQKRYKDKLDPHYLAHQQQSGEDESNDLQKLNFQLLEEENSSTYHQKTLICTVCLSTFEQQQERSPMHETVSFNEDQTTANEISTSSNVGRNNSKKINFCSVGCRELYFEEGICGLTDYEEEYLNSTNNNNGRCKRKQRSKIHPNSHVNAGIQHQQFPWPLVDVGGPFEEFPLPTTERIDQKDLMTANGWTPILGRDMTNCLFSRDWNIREMALKRLARELANLKAKDHHMDPQAQDHLERIWKCTSEVLAKTARDNVFKVYSASVQCLRTLLAYTQVYHHPSPDTLAHDCFKLTFVQIKALLKPVLHSIFLQCSEINKQRQCQLGLEFMAELAKGHCGMASVSENSEVFFDANFVVGLICEDSAKSGCGGGSWQLTLGKLNVLDFLIARLRVDAEQPEGFDLRVLAAMAKLSSKNIEAGHPNVGKIAKSVFVKSSAMLKVFGSGGGDKQGLEALECLSTVEPSLRSKLGRRIAKAVLTLRENETIIEEESCSSSTLESYLFSDKMSTISSTLSQDTFGHYNSPIHQQPTKKVYKRESPSTSASRSSNGRHRSPLSAHQSTQVVYHAQLQQAAPPPVLRKTSLDERQQETSTFGGGKIRRPSGLQKKRRASDMVLPNKPVLRERPYHLRPKAANLKQPQPQNRYPTSPEEPDPLPRPDFRYDAEQQQPYLPAALVPQQHRLTYFPDDQEPTSLGSIEADNPLNLVQNRTSTTTTGLMDSSATSEDVSLALALSKSIQYETPIPFIPGLSNFDSIVYNDGLSPRSKRLICEETRVPSSYLEDIHWHKGPLLGSGAFSSCFQARDVHTGAIMAVKQIDLGRANDEDERMRLGNLVAEEVGLLSRLRHPHVIRMFGAVRDDSQQKSSSQMNLHQQQQQQNNNNNSSTSPLPGQMGPVLNVFVEWMAGGSVAALLDRHGPFGESVTLKYAFQILLGLEYLHSFGILHRDLKGANLLVDASGQHLRIADFGAAARMTSVKLGSVNGEFKGQLQGTIAFMAPEVLRGENYGRSCDIWSVGCCVIEMASAKPPWNASDVSNHLALVYKIACSQSPPAIPEEMSPELRDFTSKCLLLRPEKRPTAKELLFDRVFS